MMKCNQQRSQLSLNAVLTVIGLYITSSVTAVAMTGSLANAASVSSCRMYLAQSTIPGAGRGIFAGQSFSEEQEVDIAPTLPIHQNYVAEMQLANYVYGTNEEDYSMVIFGPANIYNHNSEGSKICVRHEWIDFDVKDSSVPQVHGFTAHTNVKHLFNKDLQAGDEIFTTYGDGWWDRHNVGDVDPGKGFCTATAGGSDCTDGGGNDNTSDASAAATTTTDDDSVESSRLGSVTLEELSKNGHCLSNVFVSESRIPFAGKGLFAQKDFKSGDVVTISPVLTLPKYVVQKATHEDKSILINYCIGQRDSDVMLFPISYAAMINHNSSAAANVLPMWYNWNTKTVSSEGNGLARFYGTISGEGSIDPEAEIKALFDAPFAQFDLAFVAQRDIPQGEELTLFYGQQWEDDWLSYSNALNRFLENLVEETKPVIYSYMTAPTGLFPDSWVDTTAHYDESM